MDFLFLLFLSEILTTLSMTVFLSRLGLTPLHLAVQTGDTKMVNFLISAGASIDITDGKSGRTPLLHASENRQTEMVELLLSHRAKVGELLATTQAVLVLQESILLYASIL